MSERQALTIAELAAALGVQRRWAEKRAAREAWPFTEDGARGGKRRAYRFDGLPSDVQLAILARRAREAKARADAEAAKCPDRTTRIADAWELFQHAPGWRKKIAERRQEALFEVANLRAQGLSLRNARERVTARLKAQGMPGGSDGALKRWGRLVKGLPRPHWLAFLMPDEKGHRELARIHPDAWAAFKLDWLRLEQPTAESCYRRLQRLAGVHTEWNPLPDRKTFERRIQREVSTPQRILAREGEEALARIGPKIERDRSDLQAMQAVNADGHMFDVAVQFPDGSTGRPVIVGWQDIASGKVLSYRIGRSETADLVRLSFCDMVRKYGIPKCAHLDNGRAFASKKNTGGVPTRYRYKVREEDPQGVITRLGVAVHWVQPYNGKAKPIERAWRDFAEDISKRPEFAGAYLGNNPTAKPENYGSRAVPLDEFLRVVADGIAEHNARTGRRSKVCDGRSFDAVFAASYAEATITKASAAQLSMLLLASDVVMVNRRTGDVTMAGNRYWSESLCAYMGQRVELRFDPEALQADVHAFELGGQYIDAVPCTFALGYETSDEARAAVRAQRAWLKANKELRRTEKERDAARSPRSLPPLSEPEPPRAAVVALHVPKRERSTVPAPAPADEGPSEFEKMFAKMQEERARNAL